MSTNTLLEQVQKEIDSLNSEIDMRIIKGLSYRKEARRHRFLSKQLTVLTAPPKHFVLKRRIVSPQWFRRVARAVASFTL